MCIASRHSQGNPGLAGPAGTPGKDGPKGVRGDGVLLEDPGTLACVGRLGLLERREILVKMDLT